MFSRASLILKHVLIGRKSSVMRLYSSVSRMFSCAVIWENVWYSISNFEARLDWAQVLEPLCGATILAYQPHAFYGVGQNHIWMHVYTYTRYSLQGFYQIYGHVRRIQSWPTLLYCTVIWGGIWQSANKCWNLLLRPLPLHFLLKPAAGMCLCISNWDSFPSWHISLFQTGNFSPVELIPLYLNTTRQVSLWLRALMGPSTEVRT